MPPERYSTLARAFVSVNDPTSTMDYNGRLVYSAESGDLFLFIADSDYGTGSWVNLGSGGGTGTPGTPALSIQGASADGTTFVGIPNSSFDDTTGDVTLGANFLVDSASNVIDAFTGNGEYFGTIDPQGIEIDATGIAIDSSGTGPINLNSAGGINLNSNSPSGVSIIETNSGTGIAVQDAGGGGLTIEETGGASTLQIINTGTGSLNLGSSGGVSITDNSANGLTINESLGTLTIEQSDSGSSLIMADDGTTILTGSGPLTIIALNTLALTSAVGQPTLNGNPILTALVGVTPAIGGSALTLGQQATDTVVIAGATAAIAAGAIIQATPTTADAPGDGFIWTANLTGTLDTIEVKVLCLVAGTPTSTTYNVKVI